MGRTLDNQAKRNGATALLESHNVKGFIEICESFANPRGHFWATTKPYKLTTPLNERAALNRATGKQHGTLIAYRKFCKAHGVLKEIPRAVVDALYDTDDPTKPPKGVNVWEVTGVVKPCADAHKLREKGKKKGQPLCDCLNFIHGAVQFLYMDSGEEPSLKIEHEGSTVFEVVPVEGSVPAQPPKPTPAPKPRDLIFDAVCRVFFRIDPLAVASTDIPGGRVGDVKKAIIGLEPTVTDERIVKFGAWYDAAQDGASRPRNVDKVKEHWLAFMQSHVIEDYDPLSAKMREANHNGQKQHS